MKIISIRTGVCPLKLEKTFRTAIRETNTIDQLIVELQTECGKTGKGAACAIPKITGETLEGMTHVIERVIFPKIDNRDICQINAINNAIQNSIVHNPAAKAAVDMAVHDLWRQYLQKPLHQIFGGAHNELVTNMTLSMDNPEKMAEDAKKAVKEGFNALKLKVGSYLDIDRVSAVRQAVGDKVTLRLDANQAWSPKQALKIIHSLSEYDIELIEQPVAAHDIDGLEYVSQSSPIPIMADESLFTPADALMLASRNAVDLFNIKLLKCGGISQALQILAIAQTAGIECMMGCMMEGPISVMYAIQLAATHSIVTRIDLDSLLFLQEKDRIISGIEYGRQIKIIAE